MKDEFQRKSLRQTLKVYFARNSVYSMWQEQNSPTKSNFNSLQQQNQSLEYRPIISVIMPTYNTPDKFLRAALESVLSQTYESWQLCIADDFSTEPQVRNTLQHYREKDARIEVIYRTENGHISAASNSAITLAKGDFIVFLDHDDELSEDALMQMVVMLNKYPEADLIYSDEDKLDYRGERIDPFFKPDWSPDFILSSMYTCHLSLYRKTLFDQLGGLKVGYEGSQDYDLVLRFSEFTTHIFHIPKILYHWRIFPDSTAGGATAKSYASRAGLRALQDALDRRDQNAFATEIPNHPGHYEVRYKIDGNPLISLIVNFHEQSAISTEYIESLYEKCSYKNIEFVLSPPSGIKFSHANSMFDARHAWTKRINTVVSRPGSGFAEVCNEAAKLANGEYLLFLDPDIEPKNTDWLEALLMHAQRQTVGAVSGKILNPDGTIYHAGMVIGRDGLVHHCHHNKPAAFRGYFNNAVTVTNYSSVSASCLMCKKDRFFKVDGFNTDMTRPFVDADFCLELQKSGFSNLYVPYSITIKSEVGMYDQVTLGSDFTQCRSLFCKKWSSIIEFDPCYNPNLSTKPELFLLRIE